MVSKFVRILLRAGVCAVAVAAAGAAQAESLRIGGTGVALGGMRLLGEEFARTHPEVAVEVVPSLGSSGGIKAVLAGAVDVAVSSRGIKDEERAAGAEGQPYARTPLAFVTHPATATDGITSAELAAIYAGTMTRWLDGSPIRLVLRPEYETDMKRLRALSPQMDRAMGAAFARDGLVSAGNDQENAATLEALPGSIGVAAFGQILTENRALKVLTVDGVHPGAELVGEGDGRFETQLFLVLPPSASPLATEFAAFVTSPQGRAVLARTGHSLMN